MHSITTNHTADDFAHIGIEHLADKGPSDHHAITQAIHDTKGV